jgi:hypothetical protein
MTGPLARADELAAALDVLARAGLAGCGATAAGPDGEVLLLSVPEALEERLAGAAGDRLRTQLRDTGFRYVALDLAPRTESP